MTSTKYIDIVMLTKGYSIMIDEYRYGSGLFAVMGYTTDSNEAIVSSFTDGDDDYDIINSFYGGGNPIALYAVGDTVLEVIANMNEVCRRVLQASSDGFGDWQDITCDVREAYVDAVKSRMWEDRQFKGELKVKIDAFKALMDAVPPEDQDVQVSDTPVS